MHAHTVASHLSYMYLFLSNVEKIGEPGDEATHVSLLISQSSRRVLPIQVGDLQLPLNFCIYHTSHEFVYV